MSGRTMMAADLPFDRVAEKWAHSWYCTCSDPLGGKDCKATKYSQSVAALARTIACAIDEADNLRAAALLKAAEDGKKGPSRFQHGR